MSLSSMIRKAITATKHPHKAKRAPRQIEQLERREVFVVAADGVAEAVAAGTGFDGVVQLGLPNAGCTGSLLWTGRHIITAAHCVDFDVDSDRDGNFDRGNGSVDAGTASVRFDMPGRSITQFVPMTNVTLHSSWTGSIGGGNDIAIITLAELAPSGSVGVTGADRYQIYRNTNEVDRVFRFVGYGLTNGPGGSIDNTGTSGTKRQGQNRFDSAGGTFLRFDFDSSTASSAVTNESNTASGDSGGPSFLDGRIAAITSGGERNDSGLGDRSFNTRVSDFASWIDTTVGGAYDLVLDMSRQMVGGDGRDDTFRVQRNGSNLELLVNGAVYHADLASNIRSIKIVGSGDNDYVELATQVTFDLDGRGGTNALAAPNQFNAWNLSGLNRGRIGDWASFTSVQTIKGSSNSDIFSFETGGRVSGSINGGGGIDVLDYRKYTTTVDVNLLQSRATSTGGISNIENVKGGSGNDLLVGDAGANVLNGYGGHDVLDGGDGTDELYGGAGRDLLIGGFGADKLSGEGDEDLLIAGRLSGSATSVRTEWIRTDISYDARVANLRVSRVTPSTISDDGAADTLNGGDAMDWYWGTMSEVTHREYDFSRSRWELLN